jgi:putative flavoprotein involved in K+ transport
VVAATGPFQPPIIPAVVPANAGIVQIYSAAYRRPTARRAVLVVGASSSGAQIADEVQRAGSRVYLSMARTIGPRRLAARISSGGWAHWAIGCIKL